MPFLHVLDIGLCHNLKHFPFQKLKSEKNLVIAKMDATANDAPEEFSASGFPTIYFAPANNKACLFLT